MKLEQELNSRELSEELEEFTATVLAIAQQSQGDCGRLLSLLRTLEYLHREIREKLFQPSLPNNRNQLYSLLRDIEESGGWPYIERMRIQTLIDLLGKSAEFKKSQETDAHDPLREKDSPDLRDLQD
jgi:hypothetical protein